MLDTNDVMNVSRRCVPPLLTNVSGRNSTQNNFKCRRCRSGAPSYGHVHLLLPPTAHLSTNSIQPHLTPSQSTSSHLDYLFASLQFVNDSCIEMAPN